MPPFFGRFNCISDSVVVETRRSCIYISGYFSCQSSKQVLQQTIPVKSAMDFGRKTGVEKNLTKSWKYLHFERQYLPLIDYCRYNELYHV